MALRALAYLVRTLERHRQQHPEEERLPLVLPVVVHHDRGGWTAPREVRELFGLDEATLAACGPHLPALKLILDDLGRQPDEALRGRAMSPRARLTLMALKHGRDSPDAAERLAGCAEEILDVLAEPDGLTFLNTVASYTLVVTKHDVRPEDFRRALAPLLGPVVEELSMDFSKELMEKWHARGQAEGQRQYAHSSLLRVLARRGFTLPPGLEERIAVEQDLGRLERWLDAAVTAARVEDVFESR